MKKPALYVLLGILLVAAAVLIVTTWNRPSGTLRIGAILPLTGEAAPYGEAARRAIEMAAEEVNAAGGINGRKVEVIYEDDQLDPKMAVNAATKLCTADKVSAIIGPMASAAVEAVLPITQRHKTVVVSPAATASSLSGKKGFFRTIVSDVYDGTAMAEFAYNELGYRKVPVLHIQAAGPAGVADSFAKRFRQLGGEVPLVEVAAPNTTDFRAQLTKIKAVEADGVYFAAYAHETATILKQAKELGVNKQLLTHQLAEDPEVRQRAGDAADGLIYTTPKLDPATGGPAVKKFYDDFKARYGIEPRNFASNSYDALRLIAKALAQSGRDYDAIVDGLLSTRDYSGASGTLSFDQNGDVQQPMRIMTIRNGEVVEYGR